mmetsp:Transcript_14882/g.32844  ORF Transcript_14882/g.32844 Transcript_14882/m.32844 type:complete len:290 (+) Transcript_14882:678-1547(+)
MRHLGREGSRQGGGGRFGLVDGVEFLQVCAPDTHAAQVAVHVVLGVQGDGAAIAGAALALAVHVYNYGVQVGQREGGQSLKPGLVLESPRLAEGAVAQSRHDAAPGVLVSRPPLSLLRLAGQKLPLYQRGALGGVHYAPGSDLGPLGEHQPKVVVHLDLLHRIRAQLLGQVQEDHLRATHRALPRRPALSHPLYDAHAAEPDVALVVPREGVLGGGEEDVDGGHAPPALALVLIVNLLLLQLPVQLRQQVEVDCHCLRGSQQLSHGLVQIPPVAQEGREEAQAGHGEAI